MTHDKIHIIGIAGASGSGKTTFAKHLLRELGDLASVFSLDNFYHGIGDKNPKTVNFDSPESLDFEMLRSCLKAIKESGRVFIPDYDHKTHQRKAKKIEIAPRKYLIVEGILLFHDPDVVSFFDQKIYIETSPDVCLARRILRDINERGRTAEDVIRQYLDQVKPMFETYVAPSKKHADIVISSDDDVTKPAQTFAQSLASSDMVK